MLEKKLVHIRNETGGVQTPEKQAVSKQLSLSEKAQVKQGQTLRTVTNKIN